MLDWAGRLKGALNEKQGEKRWDSLHQMNMTGIM